MSLPDPLASIATGWRRMPRRGRWAIVIIVVELLIAAVGAPFAMMALDDARAELAALRSQVVRTRSQAVAARRDHEYVTANQDQYEAVLASGMMQPQDRLAAKGALERIALGRNLGTLLFEFAPETVTPNGRALEVVSTPLTLRAGAIFDRDIVRMMKDVGEALPGTVIVNGLSLNRTGTITPDVLAEITSGISVDLVTAEVKMEWRTARPPAGHVADKDEEDDE